MPDTTSKIGASGHQGLEQDWDTLSLVVTSAHNPPIDKIKSVFKYLDIHRIPKTNKPSAKDV
jgi:hypothetical protein